MEAIAAKVSKIAAISSHAGHEGFDAIKQYMEMSSEDCRAALIMSELYVHDMGIGGCIKMNNTPVATTNNKHLFADCI